MIKVLRYAGVCLLVAADLLLFYSFSYSFLKDQTVVEPDQYAVLFLSTETDAFPGTDYDALVSKMNLPSRSVMLSEGSSDAVRSGEISDGIDLLESGQVILLAWKDACMPALSAAVTEERIAGVILLSPYMSGTDSLEIYGTHRPDVPVGIFDTQSLRSVSLYERLSGEDATLFPGLQLDGILPTEIHISPDGSRYLHRTAIPGSTILGQELLAYMPQVQTAVGEFIGTYVIGPAFSQSGDVQTNVAVSQGVKILALTFFFSGILIFFSTVPKPVRETLGDGRPSTAPEVTKVQKSDILRSRREYYRSCVYMSFLNILAALLLLAALIVLYYWMPALIAPVLSIWPFVYYVGCAAVMVRFFPKSIRTSRVAVKRVVFSSVLALLVVLGLYMIRKMHVFGFADHFEGVRVLLILIPSALLFLFVWIRLATDSFYQKDGEIQASAGHFGGWHRQKSLVIPYLGIFGLGLLTGAETIAVRTILLLMVLLICLWVRFIFRKVSGSDWFAALVFAITYSFLSLL
jgi:hypothetical protein